MANKRISDFPTATEVTADDYLLVASGENTYKAKASSLPGNGTSSEEIAALTEAVENAQTAADSAKTKAESAQTTANEAKTLAGGSFIKIAELTLAESKSGNLDYKTDADGKAFSVSEVAVRIDAPASSGAVSGYVAVVSENALNWNNACTFGYLPKIVDTTKQTSVATVNVYGGACALLRFFKFGEYFWNSTGLSETVYPGKIQWPGGKINWIRVSSSSALPAGTVISIYGR